MDVRQLRCFVAVAEELHFGRAAARLHVAQPAVSQTIRSLESELGLELFRRTNRKVELTPDGAVLLGEAMGVVDRFDGLVATMGRRRSGEEGSVRIGIVAALPPQLIPRLLAATAAGAPEISVVVAAIPGARSPAEALEHDLDLAVVRGAVDEPGLGSALLASEPVGIALPADHPLAAADVVSPRDLNGQPMVTFAQSADPQEYDRLYGAMAAAGLRDLRVEHESHPGSVDASLRLVASGAALSLKLESEVVAFASDLVTWRPLQGVDLRVVISAAWRPDRTSPALTRLLPIVLSAASEVVAPPAVTTDEPATRSGR